MGIDRVFKSLELTLGQSRFVLALAILAVTLSGWLLVAAYSTPGASSPELPVIMGDANREFTGVFVIDPNRSPVDSLELLPGIGPVLAERIVKYRESHPFENEVDITEVRGIGPKLYERLRPYLRIKRSR